MHVHEHLILRHGQTAAHGLNNAQIGLMGDEQIDIVYGQLVAFQHFFAFSGHATHRMAEDFTTLHGNEELVGYGLSGLDAHGGAAAHGNQLVKGTVGAA